MSYLVQRLVPDEIFAIRVDLQLLQSANEETNDLSTSSRTDPWDHLWTDVGGEG